MYELLGGYSENLKARVTWDFWGCIHNLSPVCAFIFVWVKFFQKIYRILKTTCSTLSHWALNKRILYDRLTQRIVKGMKNYRFFSSEDLQFQLFMIGPGRNHLCTSRELPFFFQNSSSEAGLKGEHFLNSNFVVFLKCFLCLDLDQAILTYFYQGILMCFDLNHSIEAMFVCLGWLFSWKINLHSSVKSFAASSRFSSTLHWT